MKLCTRLSLAATCCLVAATVALAEPQVGAMVEYTTGFSWDAGVVRRTSGPLVLVSDAGDDVEANWRWVRAEQVRSPGEQTAMPPINRQLDVPVADRTVGAARREAATEYASLTGGTAPADNEPPAARPGSDRSQDPRLRPGQMIQYPWGRGWSDAIIRGVSGELVLVQTSLHSDSQMSWQWRALDQLKLPGESKPDPDPFARVDYVEERVGIGTIEEARVKAEQALAAVRRANDPSVKTIGGGGGVTPGGFGQGGGADGVPDRTPVPARAYQYQPAEPAQPVAALREARLTPAGDGDVNAFEVVGRERPMALVGRVVGRGSEPTAVGAELVDLVAGAGKVIELPTDLRALAASPDATRIAARSDAFGFGKSNRLEVHDVDVKAGTATPIGKVFPFGRDGIESDIEAAHFVGDAGQSVLVQSQRNRVMLLRVPELDRGWQATADAVAVRDDGNAIALASGGAVHLLDLVGNVLATLDGEVGSVASMAFDPGGKRLAVQADGTLRVWNLADGGKLQLGTGVAPGGNRAMAFAGDLLLVGSVLVDPATGGQVWRYADRPAHLDAAGTTPIALRNPVGNQPGSVAPLNIPHRDALAAMDKVTTRDLFADGGKVKLEVRNLPGEWSAKATENLTKQIQAMGLTIDPAADVAIVAETTQGQARSEEFGDFHRGPFNRGPTETVNSQDLQHTLRVLGPDGETAWARGSSWSMPSIVHLGRGQSVGGEVQQQADASYRFYEGVRLPPAVVQTTSPVGESPLR